MAMRKVLPLCAQLTDVTRVATGSRLGRFSTQTAAGTAAAAWYGCRRFASSGEGASLRQSADQHLQDGAPESQPRPDSTAINQKAPLSTDDKGKPQVGKVSTPEEGKEGGAESSAAESDDTIPNLQTPKDK